jgi:methyl halide transferase
MKDWEAHYQTGDTPWDKGRVAPPLMELIGRHGAALWQGGPVLVPGCGSGHDVRAIADLGIPAHGLDIAPTAIRKALSVVHHGPVSFELGDFLSPVWREGRSYPAIWEHTCYCAIPPEMRRAYAGAVADLLPVGGILCGVFYLTPYDPGEEATGPPFGTSVEELKNTFAPWFDCRDSWVPESAYLGREGREWIGIFQKVRQARVAGQADSR